jgi:uncharacterized phage protein (TIGR02216 family)
MQLGLGVLRLPPSHFWSMTMPEFKAAVEGYARSKGMDMEVLRDLLPLNRTELAALQQNFPDDVIKD